MNKLKKPKFFTTPIWGNISVVSGIIACFSFSQYISDNLFIIIIVGLIILFLLWNLIKYIINWNNFYDDYLNFEKKFNELETAYNVRIKDIDKKNQLIEGYEYFINILQQFIISCITTNTDKEIEQITNLQKVLYISKEHLNNLKGDD